MKDIYGHVRVCPFKSIGGNNEVYCDLELDPDVQKIMIHSRDNNELTHVWREWHDRVGPQMKNKYMRYVDLANQAARINGKNCSHVLCLVRLTFGCVLGYIFYGLYLFHEIF